MTAKIIEILRTLFPPEIVTLILGALPISELRGAIPLALGVFHFSIPKAFILSVIGNLIPILPILLLLDSVSAWLSRKSKLFNKFFTWLFARTRKRSAIIEKYGALGLILFVAIPLPVTGAWTGSVAAFLFGVRIKWAAPCIIAGVLIAGIIVTLVSLGVFSLIS